MLTRSQRPTVVNKTETRKIARRTRFEQRREMVVVGGGANGIGFVNNDPQIEQTMLD